MYLSIWYRYTYYVATKYYIHEITLRIADWFTELDIPHFRHAVIITGAGKYGTSSVSLCLIGLKAQHNLHYSLYTIPNALFKNRYTIIFEFHPITKIIRSLITKNAVCT